MLLAHALALSANHFFVARKSHFEYVHSVRNELAKLILVGTRITYPTTGNACLLCMQIFYFLIENLFDECPANNYSDYHPDAQYTRTYILRVMRGWIRFEAVGASGEWSDFLARIERRTPSHELQQRPKRLAAQTTATNDNNSSSIISTTTIVKEIYQ